MGDFGPLLQETEQSARNSAKKKNFVIALALTVIHGVYYLA